MGRHVPVAGGEEPLSLEDRDQIHTMARGNTPVRFDAEMEHLQQGGSIKAGGCSREEITTKSAKTKAPITKKLPAAKMTKTQVLRYMADEWEYHPSR